MNNDTAAGFVALVFLAVVFIGLYFLPYWYARSVDHPDASAILVLNFLLGWLLIPWVLALVWANKKPTTAVVVAASPSLMERATASPAESIATKTCPFCAEEIKAAAIKCKHCGEAIGAPA